MLLKKISTMTKFKKTLWISKNNVRKLSIKQKQKIEKTAQAQLFQLNCMLQRQMSDAQIKQKEFEIIFSKNSKKHDNQKKLWFNDKKYIIEM